MQFRHPLLRRQASRHLGPLGSPADWPAPLRRFVAAVEEAYEQSDADRRLVERSLDLSSQELLQANSDMRAIIEAFPDLFLWVSPEGTVLGCRAQDSSDLLLPPAALVGKRLQDIPDRTAAARFAEAIGQIAAGARLVTIEYPLERVGAPCHYEARLVRIDERQILVIVRNITSRFTAEADLERSVSVLQATLESTTDGILVVEATGRIATYNHKFAELWAIPDAILEARDDHQALAYVLDQLCDPEAFLARVQALYDQPDAESFDEIRLQDGRVFERRSMPQRIGGQSVGRVWSFRDVTERHRAEQELRDREAELRQAQKMEAVGLLAGGIAHDFNNLLTAITGYAGLILDQIDASHPLRADAEAIQKAGESAAALTDQLLAFSRRQILKPRILDLNAVVSRTHALLSRLIGEDIELVVRLASPLQRVNADPGQMEQIILNLAVNARDAMPQGGTLTIETANVQLDRAALARHGDLAPGSYVRLAVIDTGLGIPEETQPHIFEPFYTTKPRGEGTGLGLATVYGIVKQSGGAVWFDSRTGRGTTFAVHLPAAVAERDEPAPAQPLRALGGRETILIAEDQPEVRAVTETVLMRQGYRVLSANSGEEALRIAQECGEAIHLLLTDVVMPAMGGRELVARLHEVRPELRVLYASGYTDDAIVRRGVLESGVAFLQKPFTPAGLLAKVREVLDQPAGTIR